MEGCSVGPWPEPGGQTRRRVPLSFSLPGTWEGVDQRPGVGVAPAGRRSVAGRGAQRQRWHRWVRWGQHPARGAETESAPCSPPHGLLGSSQAQPAGRPSPPPVSSVPPRAAGGPGNPSLENSRHLGTRSLATGGGPVHCRGAASLVPRCPRQRPSIVRTEVCPDISQCPLEGRVALRRAAAPRSWTWHTLSDRLCSRHRGHARPARPLLPLGCPCCLAVQLIQVRSSLL